MWIAKCRWQDGQSLGPQSSAVAGLLFLILTALAWAGEAAAQADIEQLYEKGKAAYSAGNYEEAVRLFTIVNEIQPGYKWVNWRLSRAQKQVEKQAKARQLQELEAAYSRAQTLLNAGKTDEAKAEFQKIAAVDPKFRKVGEILKNMETKPPVPAAEAAQPVEVPKKKRSLSSADKKRAAELYAHGRYLVKKGDYERAATVFATLLEIDPTYKDAPYWASECQKRLALAAAGGIAQAPAEKEKPAPGQAPAAAERPAESRTQVGEPAVPAAEKPAEKPVAAERPTPAKPPAAVTRPPEPGKVALSAEATIDQALLLLRMAKYEEAVERLKSIQPESPQAALAEEIRTECEKRIRDRDLARAELRRGKVDKERAKRLREDYSLALAAYEKKQYDRAIELSQKIVEDDPFYGKAQSLLQEAQQVKAQRGREISERTRQLLVDRNLDELDLASVPPETRPPIERPALSEKYSFKVETDKALEAKLAQRISANYEGPLDYLLDILFRATGVNIIADPSVLESAGAIRLDCEDIPLSEVLDFITRTYDNVVFTRGENVVYVTTPQRAKLVTKAIRLRKGLTDVTTAGGTGSTAITLSDIEKFLAQLPQICPKWTPESTYWFDRKLNFLYLKSTPEGLAQAAELISHLDITPPQVLIETRFVELSSEDFERLGLNWEFDADLGRAGTLEPGSNLNFPAQTIGREPAPEGGATLKFSNILSDVQYRVVLDALRRTGRARVLVAPSVIAMNNSTATIDITQQLVYVEDYEINRADISGINVGGTSTTGGTGTAPPVTSLSEPIVIPVFNTDKEVGFTLNVTPSVGEDSREITIVIAPEITEEVERLSFELGVPDTVKTKSPLVVEQPVIAKRTITTKLTVADGSVVAIGGLMRQQKGKIVQKVPLLSDIPVLGTLFRRTTEQDTKTNLIIFVKATIYNPEGRQYADSGKTDVSAPAVPAAQPAAATEEIQVQTGE